MKTSYSTLLMVLCLLAGSGFSGSLSAQPPGRGEDRGGERGDRGGRGSWGGGDRGSWGGGDRGGERGGERGSRGGDRGGERGGWGGPPGGGFPGGPPGGGFPGGGGPPGGGRGGFDPSAMIDRMDRNNNGMIDPDEMEGPAQMMISRLQREDPSIRTDRPIPVAKIKEAFEQMRGGRGPGERGEGSGVDNREQINAALTPAPLVPGFGEPKVLEPVLGFGPAAELMSVEVTPADLKEAEESLQRYDRNRDGFLSGEEVSRRWPGNPMDFDRNGDGKLSLSELAVRAARLRVVEVEVRAASDRRNNQPRGERAAAPAETPDPFNGRRSFATTKRSLPEGLPGWFAEKDSDGDQQVSMAEYSSQWTASLVEEFQQFDRNGDGFITVAECLAAVRGGATASGGSSSVASSSSRGPSSGSSGYSGSRGSRSGMSSRSSFGGGSSGGGAPAAAGSAAASSPAPGGPPDAKTMEYAQRIISRNDKNGDGNLTADEWKDMLVDPSPADADKDGRITPVEYAQWMQARSRR